MFGAPQGRPRLPLGGGGFGPPMAGTGLGRAPRRPMVGPNSPAAVNARARAAGTSPTRPPMVGPNSPAAVNARARAAGRLAPPMAGTAAGPGAPTFPPGHRPRIPSRGGGFAPPLIGTGGGPGAPRFAPRHRPTITFGGGGFAPPRAGAGTGGFAPPRAVAGTGGFAPPMAGAGTGGFAPPMAGAGLGKSPINSAPQVMKQQKKGMGLFKNRKSAALVGLGLGIAASVAMNRRGEGVSSGRQSNARY